MLALLFVAAPAAARPTNEGCAAVPYAYTAPGTVTVPEAASVGITGVGEWRVVRERPRADGGSDFEVFLGDASGARSYPDALRVGDSVHCRSYGGVVLAGRLVV